MKYYLFLDDTRRPQDINWVALPFQCPWMIVKSFEEFVACVQQYGIPEFISYDCDLADEHYQAYLRLGAYYLNVYPTFRVKCGIDCANHMINLCSSRRQPHPDFIVHSLNEHARPFIIHKIRKYNFSMQGE